MPVEISKTFDFDAAHYLPHVADDHKCKRLHGHTYRVEIRMTGERQTDGYARGMVVDYDDIAAAWAPLHDMLDHRLLNDIGGLENPTTEVLAPWILTRISIDLPQVSAVRVYESSTTWCEARR